jgi:arabinogalactan oligomer/maltooligosaccharide transport system substrate-binding protein
MRRAILVALMTVVAACSGSGAGTTTTMEAQPVTSQVTVANTTPTTAVAEIPVTAGPLVVWVSSQAVADAVRARGDAYTAATGVEVFVATIFSAPDDDRLFLDELIAGEFPEPPEGIEPPAEVPAALRRLPDLVIGPHIWLAELAGAGLAGPVELPEGLPAGAVDAVTLRGFTVGVPMAVDTIVQFRNPDLMANAPVDVSDITCAEGVGCLLLPGDGDPDVHYPFLASLGGYVFGEDAANGFAADDIGVASPGAITAAVVLQGLIEEGTVASAEDRAEARSRFDSGQAALIWDGAAMLPELGDAVVEPLPTIGSSPAVGPVRVTAAWINAGGPHPTEAAEFAVEHLASIQGSAAIARALGMAPVRSEGASDGERVIITAADTGRAVPYIPEGVTAWEAIAGAFERIHDGTNAGTALTDAADEIRFPS